MNIFYIYLIGAIIILGIGGVVSQKSGSRELTHEIGMLFIILAILYPIIILYCIANYTINIFRRLGKINNARTTKNQS